MATLFISDLHLDPQRPDITRAFLHFLLEEARGIDALYILGDLFEAWIGDDEDSPLAAEVITALRALSASTPCFVIRGNRDFLLGEDFARASGCTLLPDPSVIELYGRPVLLMHGDSLCTADAEYMAFRAQARDPRWQQALLAKSLEERRAIARQLRERSRMANSNKAEDIMDVTPAEVTEALRVHHTDLLIHGHTHRPAVHVLSVDDHDAQRIVLGDWDKKGWYLYCDRDGSRELRSFSIASG